MLPWVSRYKVTLTKEERGALEAMTRSWKSPAKKFQHARILLLCDRGEPWTVASIAEAVGLSTRKILSARLGSDLVVQMIASAAIAANPAKILTLIVAFLRAVIPHRYRLGFVLQGRSLCSPSVVCMVLGGSAGDSSVSVQQV